MTKPDITKGPPHPRGSRGQLVHQYCLGPGERPGEEHKHPSGIPLRDRGQCLYCDLYDDLDPNPIYPSITEVKS